MARRYVELMPEIMEPDRRGRRLPRAEAKALALRNIQVLAQSLGEATARHWIGVVQAIIRDQPELELMLADLS